jgi:hypothetical protein
MKKRQKGWFFPPQKPPKHKVPENVKIEVEMKATELVDSFLKSKYIKTTPTDEDFIYIADIYTNWYRNYFYFYSKYHSKYRSLSPNAISPFLETKFARLEYVENALFNLSYMRHTGQWLEIYTGLSVDDCLAAVKDESVFV